MPAPIDYTGVRRDALTALYPTEHRSASGSVLWMCRCDCGTTALIRFCDTSVHSCGCWQRIARNKRGVEFKHKRLHRKGVYSNHIAAGQTLQAQALLRRLGL